MCLISFSFRFCISAEYHVNFLRKLLSSDAGQNKLKLWFRFLLRQKRQDEAIISSPAGRPPLRVQNICKRFHVQTYHLASYRCGFKVMCRTVGNEGTKYAASERSRDHLRRFWSLLDEILNSVLSC